MFLLIVTIGGLLILLGIASNASGRKRLEYQQMKNNPGQVPVKKDLCPHCKSEDIRLVQVYEKEIAPAKVKTSYSANLNPLKPFTLVNKKEKVVWKAYTEKQGIYQCGNCNKTFERRIR